MNSNDQIHTTKLPSVSEIFRIASQSPFHTTEKLSTLKISVDQEFQFPLPPIAVKETPYPHRNKKLFYFLKNKAIEPEYITPYAKGSQIPISRLPSPPTIIEDTASIRQYVRDVMNSHNETTVTRNELRELLKMVRVTTVGSKSSLYKRLQTMIKDWEME